MSLASSSEISPDSQRIETLFQDQMFRQRTATDRIFVILMLVQWVFGVVLAIWLSPNTWIGATNYVHGHVYAAILLGGLITMMPVVLAIKMPGSALTRHTIAVAQMLWSALLIHLSGGRIETHFHVFGSLAFLAFYRDWRVLLTATVVVAADHFVRGVYWPLSVFGVMAESPFRWIEHAAWVAFEDVILVIACLRGVKETREICSRRAMLELTNHKIEKEVRDRTFELRATNQILGKEVNERKLAEARETHLGRIIDRCINEIYVFERDSLQFVELNGGAIENLGYSKDELLKMTPIDLKPTLDRESFVSLIEPLVSGDVDSLQFECYHRRKNGSLYPVEVHLQPAEWGETAVFVAVILDITERRKIEFERDCVQEKLVETSRRAGMAEIATGVLHNVGNVLNSVNVSANLIGEKLTASCVSSLGKAVSLLDENSDNLTEFVGSEKGKKLPKFLNQVANSLFEERDQLVIELKSLSDNVAHIKEIVSTQQSHARMGGAIETLDISELVENALSIRKSSIIRHQIEVARNFDSGYMVAVDRHKVMQILINLISNATNAIKECDGSQRNLTVGIVKTDDAICVEVQDTGTGIAKENLSKIFAHGFTTRKEGHGFGLHSSALAAKELGGSLFANSDGIGKGSSFTLTLAKTINENGSVAAVMPATPVSQIDVNHPVF